MLNFRAYLPRKAESRTRVALYLSEGTISPTSGIVGVTSLDKPSLTRTAEVRVFQLDVGTEYLVEYFPGFLLRLLSIGFGFFDTDNLMALGTLADEMTGAIHFVLGPKPTHVGQFWFLHAHSFPLAELFGYAD